MINKHILQKKQTLQNGGLSFLVLLRRCSKCNSHRMKWNFSALVEKDFKHLLYQKIRLLWAISKYARTALRAQDKKYQYLLVAKINTFNNDFKSSLLFLWSFNYLNELVCTLTCSLLVGFGIIIGMHKHLFIGWSGWILEGLGHCHGAL